MSTATDTPIKETFLETYNRELMTGRAVPSPEVYYALPAHIQLLFSPSAFAPPQPPPKNQTPRMYEPLDSNSGFLDEDVYGVYVYNGAVEDFNSVAKAVSQAYQAQGNKVQIYDISLTSDFHLATTLQELLRQRSSNGVVHRAIYLDPLRDPTFAKKVADTLTYCYKDSRLFAFDVDKTITIVDKGGLRYRIERRPIDVRPRRGEFRAPSSFRSSPPSAAPQLTLERRL